ncbi:glycerol-3-phosphate 1-O-acyltransferase PlsY [Candidatus Saganbacteria bacterium]|nr:glycerol-3-phosphate 1-O-acyltransferase PlsY [Candidatus Saganbacteria bacterium]
MNLLFLFAAAYLIGSLPFSLIFAKLFKGVDVRQVGTGNVGASNTLVSAGKRAGILAALFDLTKGFAVIILARSFSGSDGVIALCAFLAIMGHDFPIYLRFKGGKGVATTIGALLAINPYAVWAGMALYIIFLILTRYLILSTLLAISLMPILLFYLKEDIWYIIFAVAAALLMVLVHREDVKRLIEGRETKFPNVTVGA